MLLCGELYTLVNAVFISLCQRLGLTRSVRN